MPKKGEEIRGNPRSTKEYKEQCRDAVGLGAEPDQARYGHLSKVDIALLRWVVMRGSNCMWLTEGNRTIIRGFLHRLITKGPPVKDRIPSG